VTVIGPATTVKFLGLPEPASLHVNVPVTPVALMEEFPQLFTTDKTGAAGIVRGAAETALLATLVHPPTVCIAVNAPEAVVKFLGLPVPASLHIKVPVTPAALIVDPPQLFTTVKTGAAGIMRAGPIVPVEAGDIQPSVFFAVILKLLPAVMPEKIPVEFVYVTPSLLKINPVSVEVTVIVPVFTAQVGLVRFNVGAVGVVRAGAIVPVAAFDKQPSVFLAVML
jgi:hypothetical protein